MDSLVLSKNQKPLQLKYLIINVNLAYLESEVSLETGDISTISNRKHLKQQHTRIAEIMQVSRISDLL